MRSAKSVILLICLALVLVWPGTGMSQNIKVGAAIILTGPASTWGQFHAKGQQDYFRYVNEVKGGVAGRKIEMILADTAYKVPEAVAAEHAHALGLKFDAMFRLAITGSVPPSRAATMIARASLEKSLPRLASSLPFLCLIVDHLE